MSDALFIEPCNFEGASRVPRYQWTNPSAGIFDSRVMSALQCAGLLLAAADESAIRRFVAEAGQRLREKRVISLPTRVDTSIFCPAGQAQEAGYGAALTR